MCNEPKNKCGNTELKLGYIKIDNILESQSRNMVACKGHLISQSVAVQLCFGEYFWRLCSIGLQLQIRDQFLDQIYGIAAQPPFEYGIVNLRVQICNNYIIIGTVN